MATIPTGFGQWAVTIQTVGSGHLSVITCGFVNTGSATALVNQTRLRLAMGTTGTPLRASNMGTAFSIVNTYVIVNNGGVLLVDNDPTVITGVVAVANPPLNTAIIVKKPTVQAGRQFRGRMFFPPMGTDEGQISVAGIVAPAEVTAQNARWLAFYNALVFNNIPPCLLHEPPLSGITPPPTGITGFPISNKIGTIKRRIRS